MHGPRIPQNRPGAAALAAVLTALAVHPVFADPPVRGAVPTGAVRVVTLPVKGMTCALCTKGVEESVKRLNGVVGAVADLGSGLVRVEAAEGKSLSLGEVKDRVVKAGFKVGGECRIEADGRFSVSPEGRIMFRIPGTLYAYQVLEGSELLRLYKGHPGLRGDYSVSFRLHEHPRWKPPAISIIRAESLGTIPPAQGR